MKKFVVILMGLLFTSTILFAQTKVEPRKDRKTFKNEVNKNARKIKEISLKVWESSKTEVGKVIKSADKLFKNVEKEVRKETPKKWREVKKEVNKASMDVGKKLKKGNKKIESMLKKHLK